MPLYLVSLVCVVYLVENEKLTEKFSQETQDEPVYFSALYSLSVLEFHFAPPYLLDSEEKLDFVISYRVHEAYGYEFDRKNPATNLIREPGESENPCAPKRLKSLLSS